MHPELTHRAAWNTYHERGRTREREQDVDGQLLGASRSDSEERVTGLINIHGAHPWCADKNGMTPLHLASASDFDNVEILKMLIDNSADVDALNKAGESPLRIAINQKGPYSMKANYIRSRGGKDIGAPAMPSNRTNRPGPPAPPPQDTSAHSRNGTQNLDFDLPPNVKQYFSTLPKHNKTPYRSTSPSPLDEEAAYRFKLEEIADMVDGLDDYTPSAYYTLPDSDRATVDRMVSERMAEKRKAHLRLLQKPWDYNFS